MFKINEKNDKTKIVKDDLGMVEDLIEMLKNLTSMEAHAQASYKSTKNKDFLLAKEEIRKIRTKWLSLISKKDFGQVWCYDKHSCEVMMRLDEIQARFLSTKQILEAEECSEDYDVVLYWLLKLNDIGDGELKNNSSA